MTDQTNSASRQDAITDAASNAYWHMRQAAIQIAEAGGAEVHERAMFPGAIPVSRYAEPLASIGAAEVLAAAPPDPPRIHPARPAEGTAWLQIGQALGLDQGADAKSGYGLGWPRSSTSRVSPTSGISPTSITTAHRAVSGSPTAVRTRATQKTTSAATPAIAPGSRRRRPPGRPSGMPGSGARAER